jgi:SPP1 family predicted phage head-tail adaptor
MNINDFRYDIIIQNKQITRDSYGGTNEQWVDFLNLKGSVKYNSGSKGVSNEEVFNFLAVTFITHYRPITDDMRILFDGNKYKINFINPIGYKEGLSINAEKIND